jgi:xanthine dehydrogenase accessory factor
MSERLLARLAAWLADGPVVLASVVATRGATPRKRGARMLVTAQASEASIGGGLAEARVLAAARELLAAAGSTRQLEIALDGGPDAAGICGGQMRIALRRWHGEADRLRAAALAAGLARGEPVVLAPGDSGADDPATVVPDPRLLIVGGGHCGRALSAAAAALDFDRWVFDPRRDCLAAVDWDGATLLDGDETALATALDTGRELYAVLLNRDFAADVRSLAVLAQRPPAWLGMMGSRRRIRAVLDALPTHRAALAHLRAPVGIDIGAQTPAEIAISILADLLQWQARRR